MTVNIFTTLFQLSPKLKGVLWRQAYQFVSKYYKKDDWKFMNYGYASISDPNDPTEAVVLVTADEDNRFSIQLYHHVAESVDLKGLSVLEVGSGRGGGADYIKRYLKPKIMVGVDFSENAVAFCNHTYAVDGLSFGPGNANSLPFAENSFHAVINVESSHCYPSMPAVLRQVERVLYKRGYFLFADFRDREDIHILREQMYRSGLTPIREIDITANVLKALNQDDERKTVLMKSKMKETLGLDKAGGRKTAWIKETIYTHLVQWISEFLGARGSQIYNKFQRRDAVYVSFVLQKQTD
jgi:ubiquinone/menaquinone biosynthesis C-methylase UbiE